MIKIEIILEDNGSIRVNGPINNKILALGLLESAKFAVMQTQPGSPLVVPDYPPSDFKL